jgi:hypothetical protein
MGSLRIFQTWTTQWPEEGSQMFGSKGGGKVVVNLMPLDNWYSEMTEFVDSRYEFAIPDCSFDCFDSVAVSALRADRTLRLVPKTLPRALAGPCAVFGWSAGPGFTSSQAMESKAGNAGNAGNAGMSDSAIHRDSHR